MSSADKPTDRFYFTLLKIYRHPLFTKAQLQEIFNAHEKLHIAKNEYLLQQGSTANAYYVVEEGLLRFYVHDYHGNEITTQFICEQEIANEVSSLFQRIPSLQNIQAITDAKVLKISFEAFQHLYHNMESVREWGREWMSAALFKSEQRSVEMITQSASERYQQLVKTKPQIIQQAPLKQIASYLGITDTSLSRIRKEIAT